MRENYTLTRLFIDQPLGDNASIELPKDQAHYLINVLRKSVGDAVRVFNGQDGEWRAELTSASKRHAKLTILEQLREPQPCLDITLCFAPVRKHRTAFIIEKGTELGVTAFQPIITARTQFPKLNYEKLRVQAIEAAEQTERLDIPDINIARRAHDHIGNFNIQETLIFADEVGNAPPALEVLKSVEGPTSLLIGPEGGFTPEERDLLRSKDFVRPVSLGPRILRADTAALAMLTLWQAVQGDW